MVNCWVKEINVRSAVRSRQLRQLHLCLRFTVDIYTINAIASNVVKIKIFVLF